MSTVLDRLEELRKGRRVRATCYEHCDFALNLNTGPPVILCAVCGEVLHRSVRDDTVFTCQSCGRRVTA